MTKLDELRQIVDQRQKQAAAELEAAVQEDLPKWVALLEVAVKSNLNTRYITPTTVFGRNFLLFKTKTKVIVKVKGAPPFEIAHLNDYAEYTKKVTEKLGPPFTLTKKYETSPSNITFSYLRLSY